MSLALVREYFTNHAIALKYSKHHDGFATDNIPSSILHRAFHVEAFTFSGQAQNQMALELRAPVRIRLFFKTFRNVDEGIAMATAAAEAFVERVLATEYRFGTQLKNVFLQSIDIEPLADSNDNIVIARLEFESVYFKSIL